MKALKYLHSMKKTNIFPELNKIKTIFDEAIAFIKNNKTLNWIDIKTLKQQI